MTRTLLVLFFALYVSAAQARNVVVTIVQPAAVAGPAYPGFDYDIYEDFEDALASPFSESDATSILNPNDSSAEYTTNGGTYGMSCAAGSAAESFVAWDPAGTFSSVSAGWWYRTGSYANWSGDKTMCRGQDASDNTLFFIREGRSAGDNSRAVRWDLDADAVTVADATWYWFSMRWTSSGACSLAIYDTSGAQVGSTMSATGGAASLGKWWWGTYGVSSSTATYFDELYIDTTDATSPLGPPTGS